MMEYPVWSKCGLKYSNEKYTYLFVLMDTDLHSEYTRNTELSPIMPRLPVVTVTHIREKRVLESGIIFCSVYQE